MSDIYPCVDDYIIRLFIPWVTTIKHFPKIYKGGDDYITAIAYVAGNLRIVLVCL